MNTLKLLKCKVHVLLACRHGKRTLTKTMKEACAHPPCSVCSVCILKENLNGMQVQVTLAVS